ncbi:MAG TPA: pitrilysin family protein [Xanthobacteraceae bacterium]|nr:pitrilysin family protein [Xanthobacteraceae bacterium]
MKLLARFAPLFAVLCIAAAPAQAVPIERVISPGGLEAWLVRQETVSLISLEFAFAGGASQDPADKAGVANMVSALLDEGAGDLDSRAFHERLEDKAIELRFRAGRDYFNGSLRVLNEHRDDAVELLRLALTAPRFETRDVERMRSQILSGLQRDTTSPNAIAGRRWWAAAFPGHPYGRQVNGSLESVPQIGVDDLRTYVKRVLARDGLKIAIVGNLDAAAAGALIDRIFGSLPAKADLQPVPMVDPQGLGQRIVVDLNVPQTVITFGRRGVFRNDPDFMAAYILDHILGGGTFSSRFYAEIREKRGLAYSINDSLVWLKGTALMIGGTATRADRTAETLTVIESEIQRMAETGPTEEELAKAKSYLKGAYALNLDTSNKIAGALLQIQLDGLGIDYIDRRGALIDAVTLEDTKRVAQRLLKSGMLITIVGRPQGVSSN